MEVDITFQKEFVDGVISLMTKENNGAWLTLIVAAISGASAIAGAIVTNHFNHKSNVLKNEYDLSLKKMEKLHEKQLEALKLLSDITYDLNPAIWPNPDHDYDEAKSDMVHRMFNTLERLDKALKQYIYILPDDVTKEIYDVIFDCNSHHWGSTLADSPEFEPSKEDKNAAIKIHGELTNVISDFKTVLGINGGATTINKGESA